LEHPDELRAFARKCRDLAAGMTDEDTRKSLALLARDYDARAAELEAEAGLPKPEIPRPE
jgi:hypothetical protein